MRRIVRDPIVGGTAGLTVVATGSLWADLVKDGKNYSLIETGANVRALRRKQPRHLADVPAPSRDIHIVRDLVGSRLTARGNGLPVEKNIRQP
jgi:hypothetical protein